MKKESTLSSTSIAASVALLSLAATFLAPLLYLSQSISQEALHGTLLLATLFWFSSVPFWFRTAPNS